MAISLKHTKVSDKADGQDDSLLQPSHWNAEHTFIAPAKTLVGNSDDAEGPVEDISVGSGLELVDGVLNFGGAESQVLVSVADPDLPGARAVTDTATVTWEKPAAPNEDQIKANVPDNGITLAKLDHGTQGDILYYGASGAPTRLTTGTVGMFLKTGTAAVVGPPAVEATNTSWAFSGAPHAVLRDEKPNNTPGGGFDTGVWRDRVLNKKVYDTYEFVTLADATITNVGFTLVAGTYVIDWTAPAYDVAKHQTRLFNLTDNVTVAYGTQELGYYTQTRSVGTATVTVAASKSLRIQHRCEADTDATNNFGIASNMASTVTVVPVVNVFTIVKIWRVA